MILKTKTSLLIGSALLLAACGGGGGGTAATNTGGGGSGAGGTTDPCAGATAPCGGTGSSSNYANTTDVPANTNESVAGTFIYVSGTSTDFELETISGTLNPVTGAVSLNGSITGAFVDSDGPNADGEWTDGDDTGAIALLNDYEYVFLAQIANSSEVSYGFLGFGTNPSEMPTGGSATYTGESTIGANDGWYSNGTSSVAVNFGAGTANVVMEQVEFYDDADNPVTAEAYGFDTVSVNGMTITGSVLSGGNVGMSLNGGALDMTGMTSSASGQFYGWDDALGAPDEVAGVVVINSPGLDFYGLFIAD